MSTKNSNMIIQRARLSLVDLQEIPTINGKLANGYSAKLLLEKDNPKHKEAVSWIRAQIKAIAADKFGGSLDNIPLCIVDGDTHKRSEYAGHWVVSGNSQTPIPALDAAAQVMTDPDQVKALFYSGCYADAKIDLWAQDNKWGRRINCHLLAVKFAGDGEPFAAGVVPLSEAIKGFDADADAALSGFGGAPAAAPAKPADDMGFLDA